MKASFIPQNDKYLFLDMNSFFASCEQQLNPNLRGKPVAITPYIGNTGCCIAVSYEAKKLGIKTGFSVAKAKEIFPHIKVIEARPAIYKNFHHQIVDLVNEFTPHLIVKSIDEMAFVLSSHERGKDNPQKLAQNIKRKILDKVGEWMTCSVGVGPNIFWAKQAAELQKPDGLTIVRLKDIPRVLANLTLLDIKGINYNLEKTLHRLGIFSPLDLYQNDREILRNKLKMSGDYWWLRIHGYDIDTSPTKRGSIGHSCVLPPQARNWKVATQVMRKLVERAGERLRKENYEGKGIIVLVKYLGELSYHRYQKTPPFFDGFTFWELVNALWQKAPRNKPPFLIAVSAVNLSPKQGEQLELFTNRQKSRNIFYALDLVNNRYGSWTLKPASLMGSDEYAPSRIPFGNTQLK